MQEMPASCRLAPVPLDHELQVDCGFGHYDANGCGGAALESYVRWMKMKKPKLAGEKSYPYKAKKGTCPNNYKSLFQGKFI